jgi:hypothetical protein
MPEPRIPAFVDGLPVTEVAPGTPLVLRLGRELDQLDALPQLAPAR